MKENYHILEIYFSLYFLSFCAKKTFYSSSRDSEIREERSNDVLPTHSWYESRKTLIWKTWNDFLISKHFASASKRVLNKEWRSDAHLRDMHDNKLSNSHSFNMKGNIYRFKMNFICKKYDKKIAFDKIIILRSYKNVSIYLEN